MSHRLLDPKFLAGRWRLNGHARDVSGHGNHGTLVNTPTWGVFNRGRKQCIRLDGDTQRVNFGDLTYLNAVSAFTICFWMNQDVIDVADYIFRKEIDLSNTISIYTWGDGRLYIRLANGAASRGYFPAYSTVVSAVNWHHVSVVFDGSQADNISRLILYIDGVPITLVFVDTIPATTADLTGVDAVVGDPISSFDGRLYDFQIHNVPLSRDEINKIIHDPLMVR